ncbi:B3 domain-containing protein Os01g0234100 isoform X2 [Helianthus annuus]|nr:B3 domain-containing protein Os01g0234100 isoform X2 [Helianthus annuus]
MGMDHSMLTVHRSASIFLSGMIGQIVRVVDEIKRCKITTTKEDFDRWEKSLNSFELLGMKVGFLRDKVHTLATLVFESEVAVDIKQYLEARNQRKRAENEIKKAAAKLKELKGEAIKFAGIAGSLRHKVEKYEHKGGG